MNELNAIISGQIYAFLIVFCRMGAALMVLPIFGSGTITTRVRLLFSLMFSLVLMPVVYKILPPIPAEPIPFAILIGKELLIGIFIGTVAQAIITALNMAGMIASHTMSLSSAVIFNPAASQQATIIGTLFTMLGVVMMFAADLHHLMIMAAVNSYNLFIPTGDLLIGDMAQMLADTLNHSFQVGLQFSAPFVIISLGIYFAMALVARLVPQIQVFFLAIPLQIFIGLTTLTTVLSAAMLYFLVEFEAVMAPLAGL